MATTARSGQVAGPMGLRGDAGWTPAEDVVGHNGDPVDRSRDFFHPPPPEIGKVVTAHSTLVRGREPFSLFARLTIVGFLPAAILALGYLIARNDTHGSGTGPMVAMGVVALIAFALGWYYTAYRHTASYVGEAGVARYTLNGARGVRPVKSDVFVFDDAAELRTSQTRNYTNGIYTGTQYGFVWTDAQGAKRLKLNGSYYNSKGIPKRDHVFWIARAAEHAWNARQLERLQRELEANGFVQFAVNKSDFVRVGPGFFEFGMKGGLARINADEIKTLSLSDGRFTIHHKDATWLSRKGKFGFAYGEMANAQLFLIAIEKLAGFKFGDA